jgi:hypothetical protein
MSSMPIHKFREHRGGLKESMGTEFAFEHLWQLFAHIDTILMSYGVWDTHASQIKIEPYAWDHRIGWDTHVVVITGYGVIGFTDGPCSEIFRL